MMGIWDREMRKRVSMDGDGHNGAMHGHAWPC